MQNSHSVASHLFSVAAELCLHRPSDLLLLSYSNLEAFILFANGATALMQDFFLVLYFLNFSLLNQDFSDFGPQILLDYRTFLLNL